WPARPPCGKRGHPPPSAGSAPRPAHAAAVISDPLIRNRAMLGGSVAAASPSGDWPPVVLAADATLHLRSRDGERTVPARNFFTSDGAGRSTGSTALRPGELLTSVTVPAAGARRRSAYLKRMHPASGHAMIGAAAPPSTPAQTCHDCRSAITGTATVATRAAWAEDRLTGSRLTPEDIQAAADVANDGITFSGDAFGSTAYLAKLLPIYVSRALTQIATLPTRH